MCIWTRRFTLRSDANNDGWHEKTPVCWRLSQRVQIWPSPNANISSETDGGIAQRETSYEEKISSERSLIEVSTNPNHRRLIFLNNNLHLSSRLRNGWRTNETKTFIKLSKHVLCVPTEKKKIGIKQQTQIIIPRNWLLMSLKCWKRTQQHDTWRFIIALEDHQQVNANHVLIDE